MGVEIVGMPDDILAPSDNPFSPAAIKASVQREFTSIVSPGSHGAAVAVVTPVGVRVALAHRTENNWTMTVDMGVTYHGKFDGSVKILKEW